MLKCPYVLGLHSSNVVGVMINTMERIGISKIELLATLSQYPQLLCANRKNTIFYKSSILKNIGVNPIIMKHILLEYPQFYLKTNESFDTKLKALQTLGNEVTGSSIFPLVMLFNYANVIKPRLEFATKHPVEKLFTYSIAEFNKTFGKKFQPIKNSEYEDFEKDIVEEINTKGNKQL